MTTSFDPVNIVSTQSTTPLRNRAFNLCQTQKYLCELIWENEVQTGEKNRQVV